MKKLILSVLIISCCFAGNLDLMFWNVENLFDIDDNPKKRDNDFLPGGAKRYTYRSYCLKVQHLADVINHINPDMLAMVEVESKKALECLCTELRHADLWDIIIDEGPDIRGIDPALIYRKDKFIYCSHAYYPVFIMERGYHSRPIMRVDLAVIDTADTLSVFVNHWPSRRGGKAHSDKFRNYAAECLIMAVNETISKHPDYRCIMTGDFNDDRLDECIKLLENAGMTYHVKTLPKKVYGTYYHDGEWIHFDHFLSYNFDSQDLSIRSTHICAPPWIREKTTNGPLRYYKGLETLGGYSDHYPILLKLAL